MNGLKNHKYKESFVSINGEPFCSWEQVSFSVMVQILFKLLGLTSVLCLYKPGVFLSTLSHLILSGLTLICFLEEKGEAWGGG